MTDDTVRQFPGGIALPQNPLTMAPRRTDYCEHSFVIVDEHARTLRCAEPKCGAVLDAFDFVRNNAMHIQRAWDSHRTVMREAQEVAGRVSVLKKEEQRLRAMIKRLQEKSGAVVSVRGGQEK